MRVEEYQPGKRRQLGLGEIGRIAEWRSGDRRVGRLALIGRKNFGAAAAAHSQHIAIALGMQKLDRRRRVEQRLLEDQLGLACRKPGAVAERADALPRKTGKE